MLELSEKNVADYLRQRHAASAGELLVQNLTGGVANVVLKVFDTGGGERIGTDLRSEAKKRRGEPDTRMTAGSCMVLKQPLEQFKTAAEWRVERDRLWVERDCMRLLKEILPAGSVPDVLFDDPENYILSISCAPPGAIIWKQLLLAGRVDLSACDNAGALLAMMHSATRDDTGVAERFGDPLFFVQQRTDPYLAAVGIVHRDLQPAMTALAHELLTARQCLIHGDFSPKNIFAVYDTPEDEKTPRRFQRLLLLDFEVAFYGHPAFDVATLINHLLLKAFHRGVGWRSYMLGADRFWHIYRTTADPALSAAAAQLGGRLLGALLLARVDGKSPAEYIVDEPVKERIRACGRKLLENPDMDLDGALDEAAMFFPN